jgi:DNA-binding NarL/FixJ family response regulator
MFRIALREVLARQPDLEVVVDVGSVAEAIACLADHAVDAAIVDAASMPLRRELGQQCLEQLRTHPAHVDVTDVQMPGVILRAKGLEETTTLFMQHVKKCKPANVVSTASRNRRSPSSREEQRMFC